MATFGTLENLKKEWQHNEKLKEVFNYLEEAINTNSEIYKRILDMNCDQYEKVELTQDVFAIEQSYNTRKREDSFFEAHIKYVDVQFLVDGSELIEVDNISNLEQTASYAEENDYTKYSIVSNSSKLLIAEGNLAILFPKDGHMPAIQTHEGEKRIFKTVVKVPYSFFI